VWEVSDCYNPFLNRSLPHALREVDGFMSDKIGPFQLPQLRQFPHWFPPNRGESSQDRIAILPPGAIALPVGFEDIPDRAVACAASAHLDEDLGEIYRAPLMPFHHPEHAFVIGRGRKVPAVTTESFINRPAEEEGRMGRMLTPTEGLGSQGFDCQLRTTRSRLEAST